MSIKDYLLLNEVTNYLEDLKAEKVRENNGFSNNPIEELKRFIIGLRKIIDKLESED